MTTNETIEEELDLATKTAMLIAAFGQELRKAQSKKEKVVSISLAMAIDIHCDLERLAEVEDEYESLMNDVPDKRED